MSSSYKKGTKDFKNIIKLNTMFKKVLKKLRLKINKINKLATDNDGKN